MVIIKERKRLRVNKHSFLYKFMQNTQKKTSVLVTFFAEIVYNKSKKT